MTLRGPVKKDRAAPARAHRRARDVTAAWCSPPSSSSPTFFGIEPNMAVLHQVVTAQLAAKRSRHPVHAHPRRGPRRRPQAVPPEGHRQRPTGLDPRPEHDRRRRRVRAEAPLLRPAHPEEDDPPRAVLRAVGPRERVQRVALIDAFGWETPRTKDAVELFDGARPRGHRPRGARRAPTRSPREDASATSRARTTVDAGEINAHDVLAHDWILFTDETLPVAREEDG